MAQSFGGSSEDSRAEVHPQSVAFPHAQAPSLQWFLKGDLDAYIAVFSNNLATMLVGMNLLSAYLPKELIYGRIAPGVAVAMLFGCVYYTIQAVLKAKHTGQSDLCAQPFGINTPGVFAFCFSIMGPVYRETGDAHLAWKVGVLGNFLQGLFEVALSIIGPSIATAVPPVALLGSLASIGLALLFTDAFAGGMYASLASLLPFYLVMLAMCANIKIPRLPAMLPPVLVGTVCAWARQQPGVVSALEVQKSAGLLGFHPGGFAFEAFDSWSAVQPYLPVIFPVALTVSVGTIQCREVAAKAGDAYNLRWSMVGDGLASILAALLGSPFGMTVFIGHPGFKAMGARVGYNILVGVSFVVMCFTGLAGLFAAIFPPAALNPILLFIGLAICCDALEVTPHRHWPALMLSFAPCFCYWASTSCQNFATQVCNGTCVVNPNGEGAWTLDPTGTLRGMYAVGQGYLLSSIFLTTMLVKFINHEFAAAGMWAIVAAVSASCGLIHGKKLFAPWRGPEAPDPSDGPFDESRLNLHWDFVASYCLLACTAAALHLLKRHNKLSAAPHANGNTTFFEREGLLEEQVSESKAASVPPPPSREVHIEPER